jgi:dynein intermediate chain
VPNHSKTDEVSITALDFPHSETSTFWIGTEEGSIYQANRYDQPSRKAGISTSPEDIYRGHAGPVTGLHFHPSTGSIDFGDLFLTSSVDWSVKLWRAGVSGKTMAKPTTLVAPPTPAYNRSTSERVVSTSSKDQAVSGQQALHSFEAADDYVFDVKWHPHHPALFGTVDGSGKFDLWNLNQDTEVSSK